MAKIMVGAWRDDSSGPIGRERVYFQAPDASKIAHEMKKFLKWFETESEMDPVLKAGLAHLWFLTIHPIDDGNGRIGRAIADLALARSEHCSQRFYSLSVTSRSPKATY